MVEAELARSQELIAANSRRALGEMRAGARAMEGRAQFVELETTSRCNLDCLQCPREPGPGGMDVPSWVVDALGSIWPTLQNLSLHGLGEPLMARRTDEIVRALPPGTHVWFSSNLQILTERHLELLADRRGAVSCSLDAATPETYALIRGGVLARSLEHIATLRARSALKLFINMTVMKANHHEIGEFLELGKRLGVDKVVLLKLNEGESYDLVRERDGFRFDYASQHLGAPEAAEVRAQIAAHPVPFPVEDNVNLALHPPAATASEAGTATEVTEGAARAADPSLGIPVATDDAVAVVNPHQDVLCHMPWTNLHVRIDGSVRVCCHQEPIGNLSDRGIDEIWNGPELQAMRGAVAKGTLHELCHRENCPVYRGWKEGQPEPRGLRRVARVASRAVAPVVAAASLRSTLA